MAFLDPVLNPILQPLINFSPFWAIVILSFLVSAIITVVYKFATNQSEMKRLKEEQKEYQKRMKALRDNPSEMMKVQKEAMSKNMQYMKHSFKATLITILPILLIFGWMSANLAFEPIYPGETYSITANFAEGFEGQTAEVVVDSQTQLLGESTQSINGAATWDLKSESGNHVVKVKLGEQEQSKKVLITKDLDYEEPLTAYEHSDIESISINYNKLRPLGEVSLFGWQPGWLGLYIIFSIIFSMILRKALKVY